jgi:hypothetical protein
MFFRDHDAHARTAMERPRRRLTRAPRRASWFAAAISLLAFVPGTRAQAAPSDLQVKAALLYNFAVYTEWPEAAFRSPTDPLVFVVLGDDDSGLGDVLERTLRGKRIHDRPLVVKRALGTTLEGPCHVVLVMHTDRTGVARALAGIRRETLLTVGEFPGFTEMGGIVNFVYDDRRVRFEINPLQAKRSGLHLSANMLALARIVGPLR